MEIPMWVKAGSIIPILEHNRELSLLRALDNPIALEVYADENQSACGRLVLDDGWSTKDEKSTHEFCLTGEGVLFHKSTVASNYKHAQYFDKVVMYGITREPSRVLKWDKHTMDFTYDAEMQSVTVANITAAITPTHG
jgi:alpha-glucosidase (family GH31 glycosyl hydrolase)